MMSCSSRKKKEGIFCIAILSEGIFFNTCVLLSVYFVIAVVKKKHKLIFGFIFSSLCNLDDSSPPTFFEIESMKLI